MQDAIVSTGHGPGNPIVLVMKWSGSDLAAAVVGVAVVALLRQGL